MTIEVTSKKQLEEALAANPNAEIRIAKGEIEITIRGASRPLLIAMAGVWLSVAGADGAKPRLEAWENSTVTARENSTVTAWENSTVTARGNSTVTARENSTVTARGNSTVTARENSTVTARENSTVTAWENSTVTAWENSTVTARENSTVTAWENSTVTAWENSTVTARENSTVTAWGYAFVRVFSCRKVDAVSTAIVAIHAKAGAAGLVGVGGGQQLICPLPETPKAWCDHYGVEIRGEIAVVYKGVDDDYSTERARAVGLAYAPGSLPVAPDWDGGKRECGGGLHFSPHPMMTLEFHGNAKRFMACPIALEDISVHPQGLYPQKIKARGLSEPAYEVDQHGRPLSPAPASPAEAA